MAPITVGFLKTAVYMSEDREGTNRLSSWSGSGRSTLLKS